MPIKAEVYFMQPPRFLVKGQEDKVHRLRKTLYGLKQAPRTWNKRIDGYLSKLGFTKYVQEFGLYAKGKKDGVLILVCFYVNDLFVTGNNLQEVENLKKQHEDGV